MIRIFNIFRYLTLISVVIKETESVDTVNKYMKERENIIEQETEMAFGHEIKLTANELKAENIIMQLKSAEVERGFAEPSLFNFSHHYFTYKDRIEESKLYEIIQSMPKGAALHLHDVGVLKPEYLLNITYFNNLYVCFDKESSIRVKMKFADKKPKDACNSKWQLMKDARTSCGNKAFDRDLLEEFSIVTERPMELYTDVNKVWKSFCKVFHTITPLITYRPIWAQYYYDTLKAFHLDNVMYVEIRSTLPTLYELNGTNYDSLYVASLNNEVTQKFCNDHSNFIGAKLIYAPIRAVDIATVRKYLKTAMKINISFPDFFAGFDLVGQENLGRPLIDFIPELIKYKGDIDYIFHAGETNWNGLSTDWNLLDAILLGTKRIGHANALVKHPKLMNLVKSRDIALEINVLSNHVLKLADDLRNHPLSILMANDLPIVLSSDDPGLWEAEPLSHDFYVSFVGAMSKNAGLKTLKKLVWNSIKYSRMSAGEKEKAFVILERDWKNFINQVNLNKY